MLGAALALAAAVLFGVASIFFPLVQTQPLFAVVLSAAFLGRVEVISRWTALGSATIVAGAALVVLG